MSETNTAATEQQIERKRRRYKRLEEDGGIEKEKCERESSGRFPMSSGVVTSLLWVKDFDYLYEVHSNIN